jgi:hypothetical protein
MNSKELSQGFTGFGNANPTRGEPIAVRSANHDVPLFKHTKTGVDELRFRYQFPEIIPGAPFWPSCLQPPDYSKRRTCFLNTRIGYQVTAHGTKIKNAYTRDIVNVRKLAASHQPRENPKKSPKERHD